MKSKKVSTIMLALFFPLCVVDKNQNQKQLDMEWVRLRAVLRLVQIDFHVDSDKVVKIND